MAWISVNRTLTQSEMENNADIIIPYYRNLGYSDETIASMLGNIQAESSLSPVRTEIEGSGYGLIQWTPVTALQNHCSTLGISPYYSGDVQIEVIDKELGTASVNEWYTTSAFITPFVPSGATQDMIGVTPQEFKTNSINFSVDKLTILFMAGRLRPSYDPSRNHIETRKAFSRSWYEYITGTPPTPPIPPRPPEPPSEDTKKRRGRVVAIFKKKQYLQ